jgi:hypothetical protein
MAWTERYVRADAAGGGDGTTDSNSGANGAWTLAEAITSAVGGHRVNIKAGTYANTTTTRTFATAGTTTTILWWRGFKTTIGDMDTASHGTFLAGTETPAITFTTGQFSVTGAYQKFSNLDVSSAITTSGAILNTVARTQFTRCRAENSNAGASCNAFRESGGASSLVGCWGKSTSSAPAFRFGGNYTLSHGCVSEGGSIGFENANSGNVFTFCIARNGVVGFRTNNLASYVNVTSVDNSSHGLEIASATSLIPITNALFAKNTGYGINATASTGVNPIVNCAFWSNTSGQINNILESEMIGPVTETSDPFTDRTGGNYGLVPGALSRQAGTPGAFPSIATTGYVDIGAVQAQAIGGGEVSFAYFG